MAKSSTVQMPAGSPSPFHAYVWTTLWTKDDHASQIKITDDGDAGGESHVAAVTPKSIKGPRTIQDGRCFPLSSLGEESSSKVRPDHDDLGIGRRRIRSIRSPRPHC